METAKVIQQIRSMISASDTAEAIQKTRELLSEQQLEEALVHLDMIESEWNDIREQHINGLLSVDDQMRLQNINRGKLMHLLLTVGGDGDLSVNLIPKAPTTMVSPPGNQSANQAFKDGLKNFIGVALMLPAAGAIISKSWGIALCFSIAALITFLPTLRFLEKTIRYELLSWQKYLLVIGALLAAGAFNMPKP